MDLAVTFRTDKPFYVYGETVEVAAEVRNVSTRTLYVVALPRWRAAGQKRIDLLLGESDKGVRGGYYAYRMPEFRRLAAGAADRLSFTMGMPLHRPFIDRDRTYREEEIPMSGSLRLALRVAYLGTPFTPLTNDPLRELVRIQQLTQPVEVRIQVQKR